jgi:type IV pilus assembly protein PilA
MKRTPSTSRGFTLIELMVVVTVIAILSMMAVPMFRERIVRTQVAEAIDTMEFARAAVGARHVLTGAFPKDNAAAGLPPADKIVGNHVASLTVVDGALELVFGNKADGVLRGKRLSLRPAFVDGYPQVPVVWVCAAANVPDKMTLQGVDATDVPVRFLPMRCQQTGAKPG